MNKITYLIIFLFSITITAQIVTIPDASLKYKLVNTNCVDTDGDDIGDSDADLNNDGEIQVSEAEAVLWLDLSIIDGNNIIYSLDGISSFINLKKINLDSNGIEFINLSQNTALEYLSCRGNNTSNLIVDNNPNLNFLWCTSNNISNLNLSQNPNLELLRCSANQLTELDVSQNLLLKSLTFVDNQITEIDISNNTLLELLYCSQNQISNLDLSMHPNLRTLLVMDNNLSTLDLTNNPELYEVYISYNSISEIDLSQNPIIYKFSSFDNGILSLDLSENLDIGELSLREPQIDNIDLSQNLNLSRIYINSSEQQNLDLSQNINLTSVILNNNLFSFINLRNSNNTILERLSILENPNLVCIQIDDEVYANSQECIENEPPYSDEGWCVDNIGLFNEDCTLGSNDISEITNIKLYPNPVEETLNISIKESIHFNTKVFNALGILLFETNDKNSIDVSLLDSGIFFIQISTEEKVITKRFIKN